MKHNEEMINAIGGVIPNNSPCAFVSLKEFDCYALLSSFNMNENFKRNPVHVVQESILWGSRVLKSHPLYWADKRKLLTRILRSANTALFQQCKEQIGALAVDAFVGFRGVAQLRLAVTGQVKIWKFSGSINQIYPTDKNIFLPPLGSHRYSFAPHIVTIPYESHGITIVSTGSVSEFFTHTTQIFSSPDEIISAITSLKTDGAWLIIPHTNV